MGAPVQGFLLVKGDFIISTHTQNSKGKPTTFLDLYQNENNVEIIKQILVIDNKDPKKNDQMKDVSGMKIKIVEKQIYQKQKHLFPFVNWKVFDPNFKFKNFKWIN